MWAQPAEQKWTRHKYPQLSSPLCSKVLFVQPCFCRSFSMTWNLAELNSPKPAAEFAGLYRLIKMLLLKSFQRFSFRWIISSLLQFFQNLWHLHFFLLPQKCPNINEDTQYMLEHILIHTLHDFQSRSSSRHFSVPVSQALKIHLGSHVEQVGNCQKHKVTPALAEEQTLTQQDPRPD